MLVSTTYWDQFRELTDEERQNTDGGRRTRAARKAARQKKKATKKASKKSSSSSNRKKKTTKTASSSTRSSTQSKTKKKSRSKSTSMPSAKGTNTKTNNSAQQNSLLSRIISGLQSSDAGVNQMGRRAGITGNWCDDNLVQQLSILGEDWHDYLPLGATDATVQQNYDALRSNPGTAAALLDSVTESGTYVFYATGSGTTGHTGTVTVDLEHNTFTIVHAGSNGRGGESTSVITRTDAIDPERFLASFAEVDYMRIR